MPVPQGLIAPALRSCDLPYWNAYIDLSTERTDGGPIPWSKIVLYADTYDFDRQRLIDIVRSVGFAQDDVKAGKG